MGDCIIAFIDTLDNIGILTANTYNQFQNNWDRSPYYGKCSKHFNPPGPLFNVVFYLPSSLMNQSVSTYNSTLIGEGGGEGREYMDNNIYILGCCLRLYVSQLVLRLIVPGCRYLVRMHAVSYTLPHFSSY